MIRDFKLFHIHDDGQNNYVEIGAIHNEQGYKKIRQKLAEQYNLSNLEVNIQIIDANIEGDRSLTLRYTPHNNIELGDSKTEVLKHLHYLWQFDVNIVPHTIQETSMSTFNVGTRVNLEVDLIARYLERLLSKESPSANVDSNQTITEDMLRKSGF